MRLRSGFVLAMAACSALAATPVFAQQPAGGDLLSPAPLGGAPGLLRPTPQKLPVASAPAQVTPPAAKPAPKPAAPVREHAVSADPTPSLQPQTFQATAGASERYAAIVDAGGWPLVPTALRPGATGKAVAVLRRRLAIEGDLDGAEAESEAWSDALTTAVRSFQGRHGLKRSGVVAGATLKAMNVPASDRFRQLASSAQRIAGLEFNFGPRYIVANIPSASLEAVENGVVVRRYTAVAGDVKHPSPEVTSRVLAVNLNPTWTAPTRIVRNELIPKQLKDPTYLVKSRFRVFDAQGVELDPATVDWKADRSASYTLRQDSGPHNALGAIRLNMPNKHAVYMHDTPSKRGFSVDNRFLSHGCLRVEHVYDLAAWLLQGSGEWSADALRAKVALGERVDLKLAQPTPVAWVYLTGWASADGVVHFRDDVYDYDRVGGTRTALR